MKFIDVAENMPLEWYLEQEQIVAQSVTEPTMFLWRVSPTVIYGRHQVLENEVNLSYCQAHNIRIVQRKSGGGCVYADRGNLMISYISPSTHSEQVFQEYLDMMTTALQRLGVTAVKTTHNDILVDGRKVSGAACYALKTGTIVHSTMLLNVDFQHLEQAITPPAEKLQKHGVASVRQRVMNLSEVMDIQDFECKLRQVIC